ncbi:T9SS type A sorting domain-containing protein [Flavivirga abyssicola]|nr:T9SS type A sorting domain-containing protein [Flavivirga sp. MEBiC07777]WVK15380.1 T9SS type A sorting domain-containing protein [Flavivirga sp. MEBiC07777]
MKLLNMSGQLLIETKETSQLDMTGFKSGIYILQVNAGKQTKFIKIVKQ